MYKLIALDMDGTLLNSDKAISQENKDAIAKARAAGAEVVLASGRPLEGMQSKLDELSINGKTLMPSTTALVQKYLYKRTDS